MTIVMKLGGAVCALPETLDALADAYAKRPDDEPWVLVHGGGVQIDQALNALEGEPKKVAGLRVTTPAAAQVVQKTLDLIGSDIAAKLRDHGLPAIHVPATARLLQAAEKDKPAGLQRVGTATSFEAEKLSQFVPEGHLAVVTPVGWDAQGPLNVNADEGAVQVAVALEAKRLMLVTDVDGVRGATGYSIPHLTPSEARLLMDVGTAAGGMVPKLENALEALETGVEEVRIGRLDAAWDRKAAATRILPAPEVLAA